MEYQGDYKKSYEKNFHDEKIESRKAKKKLWNVIIVVFCLFVTSNSNTWVAVEKTVLIKT